MSSYDVGPWTSLPQPTAMDTGDGWKPHPWFNTTLMGGKSDSGVRVTPETALQHTPLWHGLTLLGGDVGSLELNLKRIQGETRIDDTTHRAYQLTTMRPNAIMCPNSFWECMMVRAILWGNGIAEIRRDNMGRPLPVESGGGLIPLAPEHTMPWFDKNGSLWLKSVEYLPDGHTRERMIDPVDTLHIPSLSTDGFWGRSLTSVASNRIGNGLGLEKQHNRLMANGMTPDWLFSFPMPMDPEDMQAIEGKLARDNRGLSNAGRSLFMDSGVKATQLGMTFEAAQFIDLIKMDVQMVASLLSIPAVMLNLMDKMTFSNTEESERWYINRTLRRWLNKIQQECRAKLLTDAERGGYVFCHDLGPLLQGRLQERYAAYSQGIASRILSPNEARAKEGLNPYEGGDEYANPNTTSGNQGGDPETTTEQPEDRKVTAAKLAHYMGKEDELLASGTSDAKNVLTYLEDFYTGSFFQELKQVIPNTAAEYCTARLRLWTKMAGHVQSGKSLSGLVRAQTQTSNDRVCGLLNSEFLA